MADLEDSTAQLMECALHDLLHVHISEESAGGGGAHPAQSRAHGRAMAATPADVKEAPGSYALEIDMPGLKAEQIRVRVEEGNVVVVSGERMRERAEKEKGVKYLQMERRLGKYLKKLGLPEDADSDKIAAVYEDGVLTVTVQKRPPSEPKKPKIIEVQGV